MHKLSHSIPEKVYGTHEMRAALQRMDTNSDGSVDFAEFFTYVNANLYGFGKIELQ